MEVRAKPTEAVVFVWEGRTGFRVEGLGFRDVSGLGFRAWGGWEVCRGPWALSA